VRVREEEVGGDQAGREHPWRANGFKRRRSKCFFCCF
jgi:hypothetical protein